MKEWWAGQDLDSRIKQPVEPTAAEIAARDAAQAAEEAAKQAELSRLNQKYLHPMLEIFESLDNATINLIAGYPNAVEEDEWIENFSATDPNPAEEEIYAKELEILKAIKEAFVRNEQGSTERIAALAADFNNLRRG